MTETKLKLGMRYIPDQEYFSIKEYVSNSTLGRMKPSPAHCKEYLDNPPEPTPAMKLGTLFHCLTLEPDQFESRYHVAQPDDPATPRKESVVQMVEVLMDDSKQFSDLFFVDEGDSPRKPTGVVAEIVEALDKDGIKALDRFVVEPAMNKRTKEGKEQFAEFQAKCEREGLTVVKEGHKEGAVKYQEYQLKIDGKTVVKPEDFRTAKSYSDFLKFINGKEVITTEQLETATKMAASVRAHPVAAKLLAKGKAEQAGFWIDPDTGVPCKCKFDWDSEVGDGFLVDLKSTTDASSEGFARSIAKYGYHRQDAIYSDGYFECNGKRKPFIFVACESKPPFAVGVYMLDQESKTKGRDEYKSLLAEYDQCVKSGEWPAYSGRIEKIELPRWYK